MLLEMICTGEEVLSGQIVDTNAAWFADTMMNLGIELQLRITVGDRMQDLVKVFSERSQQADVILVNGGLGPTSDDLSAEAMAQAAAVLTFRSNNHLPDDKSIYYFVGIDNARFKRPVIPGDQLMLHVSITRAREARGLWKFKAEARVDANLAAEAELLCTLRNL